VSIPPKCVRVDDDPFDTPEYQAFIDEALKHCMCERDNPCDGVLAGGPCDRRIDEMIDDSYLENEEDGE